MEQNFEDDGQQHLVDMDGATDLQFQRDTGARPKERKMVKKVIRKVSRKHERSPFVREESGPPPASSRSTREGGPLLTGDENVLQCVTSYISDTATESSETLQVHTAESIDGRMALTDNVAIILDSAAKNLASGHGDASVTLGISDGTVAEGCILPRQLEKLILG